MQNGHNCGIHFGDKLYKVCNIITVPGEEHAIMGYCYFTFVNGVVLLRGRWERINSVFKVDFYYLNIDWNSFIQMG